MTHASDRDFPGFGSRVPGQPQQGAAAAWSRDSGEDAGYSRSPLRALSRRQHSAPEDGHILRRFFKPPQKPESEQRQSLLYRVDRFSVFHGIVHLAGWAFHPQARVEALHLCFPDGLRYAVTSFGQASGDVVAAFGPLGEQARFSETFPAPPSQLDVPEAWLEVAIAGHPTVTLRDLGTPRADEPSVRIQVDFADDLKKRANGHVLEIGSRARSGVIRRYLVPETWSYTGLDVMAGENVDVVGDAHKLSRVFPSTRFDAVAAFSVLEHLMMPWKFAIELNKVLNPGAIGLITTHQCWPMHDTPWDFWRFSDAAWAALFNRATGFEILRTAMGEPAFIVAARCHPITNFGGPPDGFLASSVLFRKVGETTLDWPVEIEDLTETQYPTN